MWSKFLPTLNFFQKWKDFCVEFLHIWIQIFSILKFNLKRNSKIEKNSNLSFPLFTFVISFICLHLYHNSLQDLVFFCCIFKWIFKKNWKIWFFFAKYSTNVLFYCHFDYQGTLFPSKIFKNISKIWELNFKFFWK